MQMSGVWVVLPWPYLLTEMDLNISGKWHFSLENREIAAQGRSWQINGHINVLYPSKSGWSEELHFEQVSQAFKIFVVVYI